MSSRSIYRNKKSNPRTGLMQAASPRNGRGVALLLRGLLGLAFMAFTLGCDRMVLPPRPAGVPEGSSFDRHHRVWFLREATRERSWYENGAPATDGSQLDGLADGRRRWYAPDGVTVTTEGVYSHGRRTGAWTHRDDAGVVYAVVRYADEPSDPELAAISMDTGNENGPLDRFYPDGQRELRGGYRAGRFHGRFVRYFRNGVVEYDGEYQNGHKEGLWRIYEPGGGLLREEHYRAGLLDGAFRIYDKSSQVTYEAYFEKGNRTSERATGRLIPQPQGQGPARP